MPPTRLVTVGLTAQLVGVGWQVLWHTGLAEAFRDRGIQTDWGFLVDHTISNLGVALLAAGALRLRRRPDGWPRRAILALGLGAGLETIGAIGDMAGHVLGSESVAAFVLIGAGFAIASTARVAAARTRARNDDQQRATEQWT